MQAVEMKNGGDYQTYLASDYWKQVAEAVKARAGYRCQVCNSGGGLVAHHRTYEHKGCEMEHLDDLVCLCHDCHEAFHAPTLIKGVMRPTRMPDRKEKVRPVGRRAKKAKIVRLTDYVQHEPATPSVTAGTEGVYATRKLLDNLSLRKPTQSYVASLGVSMTRKWKRKLEGQWIPLYCFELRGQRLASAMGLIVKCPV